MNELQRAATLADDYKLTHQGISPNPNSKSVTTSKLKLTGSVPPPAGDKGFIPPRDQGETRE